MSEGITKKFSNSKGRRTEKLQTHRHEKIRSTTTQMKDRTKKIMRKESSHENISPVACASASGHTRATLQATSHIFEYHPVKSVTRNGFNVDIGALAL